MSESQNFGSSTKTQEKSPQEMYFTASEVVIHNQPYDCWVSFNDSVYDLTPLLNQFENTRLVKPLIAFAGKDVTHWFDENGEIRYHIHPVTNTRVPFTPYGPIPHVGPVIPTSQWRKLDGLPWWKDPRYKIGRLSKNPRKILIINTLTSMELTVEVCQKDTISEIRKRCRKLNLNLENYTWKHNGKVLDMSKTLEQNGILDERDLFASFGLSESFYTPALLLYFDEFVIDRKCSEIFNFAK